MRDLLICLLIVTAGVVIFSTTTVKCNRNDNRESSVVKTDTIVKIDTVCKVITKHQPVIDTFIITRTDTLNFTDSVFCKQLALEYYKRNIYQDTLLHDSSALIVLYDTAYMNGLCERKLEFRNTQATLIVTKVINQSPKSRVFVGAGIGVKGARFAVQTSVLYMRKNTVYLLGYDFNNKMPLAGLYFNINLKRK